MSSSVGMRLISSVVKNGSLKDFYKLEVDPKTLKSVELEAWEYINGFVVKHQSIPKNSTIQNELDGLMLPKAKEVPSYYANQVQERYVSEAIVKGFKDTREFLTKGSIDTDKAIQMLTDTLVGINSVTQGNRVIDFRDISKVMEEEYKRKKNEGLDAGILIGYPSVDKSSGGLVGGDVISIVGRPACKSGDSRLYVSRKEKGSGRYYTLKELYRGFNGKKAKQGRGSRYWDTSIVTRVQSLMDNDLTGLNEVEDVLYCGVKKTYTITTESGKNERATLDHLYLTEQGFTALGDLSVGMTVICKSDKIAKKQKYKQPYRKEICTKLTYSPYPTKVINDCVYNRVLEQRAVYDAFLNGVSINVFIEQLRVNKQHNFIFSDRTKHIHHKDGDPENNDPNNFKLLTNSEHGKEHCKSEVMRKRFRQNEVQTEKIVSIDYFGEEETYDVVCADPYNNFISEGFVTHNSGKTFNLLYNAHYPWYTQNKSVMVVSMEMNTVAIAQRLVSMHTKKNLTQLKKAQLSTKNYNGMITQLEGLKSYNAPLWLIDGNMNASVEDIWKLCGQFKPDFLLIDGAYLLKHPNPRINKFDRVGENTELIKHALAGNLNIPVECSWQFNREATKKMKKSKGKDKAGLEDIGYSDVIGQISSLVLGLMESESVETLHRRRVDILKGRHGETGRFDINWDFFHMNFSEIEDNPTKVDQEYDDHDKEMDETQDMGYC